MLPVAVMRFTQCSQCSPTSDGPTTVLGSMADCAGSVPHLGGRLVLWHAHRVPGEELAEGRWRQQSMEDTLIRCRRVLGDNHASTLRLAHHLAADLRALGEYQQPTNSTRTPWPATGGCGVTITPTPCGQLSTLPPTCVRWGSMNGPGNSMRIP